MRVKIYRSTFVEQVKQMLNFDSVEVEAKAKTSAVIDLHNKIYM